MDKFKIGDRIRLVKDRDNAKAGMVGTIVSDVECGDWGVKFDNKFYGGHALNGECKSGYGHWIALDEMELLENKPQFEVGQIYRVGKLSSQHQYENAIVKLVGNRSFWFTVKAIRGEAPNDFGKCSEYARALTLLTGSEIGEAIRKWDAEHGKVREVKRHAKVGQYIKALSVDSCDIGRFKVGDILKVTKEPDKPWAGRGVCFNGTKNVIEDKQYIVLEGYKSEQKGKHSYTAEQIAEAKRIVLDALKDLYQNCKGSIVFGTAETNPNIIRAYFFSKDETRMRSNKGERVALEAQNVGYASAKCSSNDEPNEWIGKCVALCKALHKPIPAFITEG